MYILKAFNPVFLISEEGACFCSSMKQACNHREAFQLHFQPHAAAERFDRPFARHVGREERGRGGQHPPTGADEHHPATAVGARAVGRDALAQQRHELLHHSHVPEKLLRKGEVETWTDM